MRDAAPSVSSAGLAVCVSLLTGAAAPVSAWSVRRSTGLGEAPRPPHSSSRPPCLLLCRRWWRSASRRPPASGLSAPRRSSPGPGSRRPGIAAAGPFTSAGGALHWKVARTRPDRARQVVVFQENDPSGRDALHAAFWDGARWDDGSGAPLGDSKASRLASASTGSADFRGFAAAHEQKSGELLVVSGVNTMERRGGVLDALRQRPGPATRSFPSPPGNPWASSTGSTSRPAPAPTRSPSWGVAERKKVNPPADQASPSRRRSGTATPTPGGRRPTWATNAAAGGIHRTDAADASPSSP